MPNPQLEVSLLKPDEAEHFMRIRHETFRPTVNKILYSRGEPSQKTLDRVVDGKCVRTNQNATDSNLIHTPHAEIRESIAKGTLFLKCVDKANGDLVAAARWNYVKPKQEGAKERTWEEVEADFSEHWPPFDESDPALLEEAFNLMDDQKREHLGIRPYYVLQTLVTYQHHERRGAGSMLVAWGCEKADEAGVDAYLEASPMGAPMYARHGFKAVGEIDIDLIKYGGDEVLKLIVSANIR
jgi:hypothetical protein